MAAIKKQAEKFTHTCFMVMPYESAVTLGEPPLLTKAADGVTYQRCADHPAWAEA